ncbi:MAG: C69 family dipeptidase [Myxococcota bacterium]
MCDSLVALGSETAEGTTLFAKNSDRKGSECQPFLQLPEAFHPPGSGVRCTHIEIPQVDHSFRVMGHSPWWVWGFEHGVNEHGLAVGNHTVFSQDPVEEAPGLIGMDLVRLALERARTAREAVDTIGTLLLAHGQGGAALSPDGAGYHNSFTIADPRDAWLLETSGRRFAARRTARDALTNHFCLSDDWEIGSWDLEAHARREGWWESRGRLDVAGAYRNPHVPGRVSEGRLRRSREILAAGDLDVARLCGALRDHGEGGVAPLSGATSDDEAYFTLCMHSEPVGTTTASLVAPLPTERSRPWPVWISFAAPCTGVFLPVYLHGLIPAELARGGAEPESDSAWWVFKQLQDVAAADLPRNVPRLREAFAKLEERMESERRQVEEEAAQSDPDTAATILSGFMVRTVAGALSEAQTLAASLA